MLQKNDNFIPTLFDMCIKQYLHPIQERLIKKEQDFDCLFYEEFNINVIGIVPHDDFYSGRCDCKQTDFGCIWINKGKPYYGCLPNKVDDPVLYQTVKHRRNGIFQGHCRLSDDKRQLRIDAFEWPETWIEINFNYPMDNNLWENDINTNKQNIQGRLNGIGVKILHHPHLHEMAIPMHQYNLQNCQLKLIQKTQQFIELALVKKEAHLNLHIIVNK